MTVGPPLGDIRAFVDKLRSYEGIGALPPIVLAALRQRMVRLAGEIADGLVFANASRSHMAQSLAVLPAAKRADPDFLVANMIPTCISDDIEAAKAVNRRTLTRYTMLPNYRNYWKEAGYTEEMEAIESAIAAGRQGDLPGLMSDRWLADATLFGPPANSARRGRRVARIRHHDADPRPLLGERQPIESGRRNLRRLHVSFCSLPSPPRKRGSRASTSPLPHWISAFAGMTTMGAVRSLRNCCTPG